MTKLERQRMQDIASLAREYRHEAWEVIIRIMKNEEEHPKYRLRCAEFVIERADGKARQRVEVSQVPAVTADDLMKIALELKEAEQDPFLKGVLDARFVPVLPEKCSADSDSGLDA